MSYPLDSLHDLLRELKDISGRERSDLAVVFDALSRKMDDIADDIALLRQEVLFMSTINPNLDQAVTDLDAAVTAKLTADATLDTQAAEGRNEAASLTAEAAKVEGLVGKLNVETAAENAAIAPQTLAPTQSVTVTGQTATGAPVVDAPVATGPDAPATQTVPTGTTN